MVYIFAICVHCESFLIKGDKMMGNKIYLVFAYLFIAMSIFHLTVAIGEDGIDVLSLMSFVLCLMIAVLDFALYFKVKKKKFNSDIKIKSGDSILEITEGGIKIKAQRIDIKN